MNIEDINLLKKQIRELQKEVLTNGSDKEKDLFKKQFWGVSPSLDLGDKLATCNNFTNSYNNKEENINIQNDKFIKKSYTILGEHIRIKEYSHNKKITSKKDREIIKDRNLKIEKKVTELISQDKNNFMLEDNCCVDYAEDIQNYFRYAENIIKQQEEKNLTDSIKRSRQKVLDYAYCNPQLEYFLTLTFNTDLAKDYKYAYSEFRKFRDRITKWYKRNYNKKFEFIATFETTQKGRWHIHMLTNLDYELFTEYRNIKEWYVNYKLKIKSQAKKDINDYISKNLWCNGIVDYIKMYDSVGSAYYLVKYMMKNSDGEDIETEKRMKEEGVKTRYKCSRGLNQPITVNIYDDEKAEEIEKALLMGVSKDLENNKIFDKTTSVYNDYTLFNRNNKEEKIVCKEYIDHNGKEKIYLNTVKEEKRIIKEIFYKKKVNKIKF